MYTSDTNPDSSKQICTEVQRSSQWYKNVHSGSQILIVVHNIDSGIEIFTSTQVTESELLYTDLHSGIQMCTQICTVVHNIDTRCAQVLQKYSYNDSLLSAALRNDEQA